MDSWREPSRKLKIRTQVDVLVAGGGPAGVASAVYAARNGAKTLLIERYGIVGGMATIGLMNPWSGEASGGFTGEILSKLGCDYPHHDNDPSNGINRRYDPELAKQVMLETLMESGAQLMLYTSVVDVIKEGNELTGVIIESKAGREVILAKVFIDCTGDGDLAARAGVPFTKGRESDGKMQPITLMFRVGGVHEKAIEKFGFVEKVMVPAGDLNELAKRAVAEGDLLFPSGHVLLYKQPVSTMVTCNMTNCIDADGLEPDDLTKAEIACRIQVPRILAFLRKYVPGYEDCHLIDTASMIGVRETRHIHGEYTLNEKDIMNQTVFEDRVVTKARFNFDVHNISGAGEDKTYQYGNSTNFYTIPYRCFIPLQIENLLISGRAISGTHMAHSNYRVMVICMAMGQATGTAAALCIRQKVKPRALDVKLLQEKMQSQGVEIENLGI